MKSSLFTSRKFWIMICDMVASIVIYFTTKYAAPELAKDILFLLGILQPVVVTVVVAITVQNVQHIKNKAFAEVEVSVLKSATIEQELPQ